MGSMDREVRERQLKKADEKYNARKAKLTAAGLEGKALAKDAVLRGLAADLRQAKARIAAAENIAKHVAETAAKDVKVKKEEAAKAKAKAAGGGKPKKEKAPKAEE